MGVYLYRFDYDIYMANTPMGKIIYTVKDILKVRAVPRIYMDEYNI